MMLSRRTRRLPPIRKRTRGTRPSYNWSAVRYRQTDAGPDAVPTPTSTAIPPPTSR
jgi:hypothetical protein